MRLLLYICFCFYLVLCDKPANKFEKLSSVDYLTLTSKRRQKRQYQKRYILSCKDERCCFYYDDQRRTPNCYRLDIRPVQRLRPQGQLPQLGTFFLTGKFPHNFLHDQWKFLLARRRKRHPYYYSQIPQGATYRCNTAQCCLYDQYNRLLQYPCISLADYYRLMDSRTQPQPVPIPVTYVPERTRIRTTIRTTIRTVRVLTTLPSTVRSTTHSTTKDFSKRIPPPVISVPHAIVPQDEEADELQKEGADKKLETMVLVTCIIIFLIAIIIGLVYYRMRKANISEQRDKFERNLQEDDNRSESHEEEEEEEEYLTSVEDNYDFAESYSAQTRRETPQRQMQADYWRTKNANDFAESYNAPPRGRAPQYQKQRQAGYTQEENIYDFVDSYKAPPRGRVPQYQKQRQAGYTQEENIYDFVDSYKAPPRGRAPQYQKQRQAGYTQEENIYDFVDSYKAPPRGRAPQYFEQAPAARRQPEDKYRGRDVRYGAPRQTQYGHQQPSKRKQGYAQQSYKQYGAGQPFEDFYGGSEGYSESDYDGQEAYSQEYAQRSIYRERRGRRPARGFPARGRRSRRPSRNY